VSFRFLIYYRYFNFLCLGSKSIQIFHFVLNLNWGCSKCVQIALFVSWNNSDFQCHFWLTVWFHTFSTIIDLFASWKLLELLCVDFGHKVRILVLSPSVQDLYRASPATFRMQMEQIQTHFEKPQIGFLPKWKIWTLFEPKLKKLKYL
jgi:hypothetical protein